MKKYFVIFAIVLLSLFGILPLFGNSYFSMHDDTQVGRVAVMARSLSDGQFPVRWVSDLGYGYGYPLFNYYGPLPYYIGGVFALFGIPAMYATKIMMGIGMLLAPILTFIMLKPFMGTMASIVSSVLFMYAPYHAVQLYVRGAVGEMYATAFLPLLFYGIMSPLVGKADRKTYVIGSLGLSLIILSHTIVGYVSVLFYVVWIGVYTLVSIMQKKIFLSVISSYGLQIVTGLFVSAFFWLPAIVEMGYTSVAGQIGGSADFRSHFVCASQLLYSPWGFGGSVAGCVDGMSFKLGIVHLALFLYALCVFWVKGFNMTKNAKILVAGFVVVIVSLVFALPLSVFVWEKLPNFAFVQYPWRFLSFASFGVAIVGGATFMHNTSLMRRIAVVIIILLILYAGKDEFRPQQYIYKPVDDYSSLRELRFRVSKISDEYLFKDVLRPKNESEVIQGVIKGEEQIVAHLNTEKSNYIKVSIRSMKEQTIQIAKAWFPGWRYYINGVEVVPQVTQGFPNLHIASGESVVELRLKNTPIRNIANILSIIAICSCIVLCVRYEKINT